MVINSFQVTGVNPWATQPYIEATKRNQNFFGAMVNALFDKENGVLSNIDQGIRNQNTNEMTNEIKSLSDQQLKNIYDSGSNPYEYASSKLGTGFIYNPYDENLTKAIESRDNTFKNDQTNIAFNEVLAKPESEIREHIANGGTVFDLFNQDNKSYIKPLNDKQNATFMLMQSEGQNTLKEKDYNDAQAYISQLSDEVRDLIYQGKWDEAKSMEGVDPNKLDLLKSQLGNLTPEGRSTLNIPLAQAYNDQDAKYISDKITSSFKEINPDGSLKYGDVKSLSDHINYGYKDVKTKRGDNLSDAEGQKAVANNVPDDNLRTIREGFFSSKNGAPKDMLQKVLDPNSNMSETQRNVFLTRVLNGYKSFLKTNFGGNPYFQDKEYQAFTQMVADQAKQTGVTINVGIKDAPSYYIGQLSDALGGFTKKDDILDNIRKNNETGRPVYRSRVNFPHYNKSSITNALLAHVKNVNKNLGDLLDKMSMSGDDSGVVDFILDLAIDELKDKDGKSITELESNGDASAIIKKALEGNKNSQFNKIITQDTFPKIIQGIYNLDIVNKNIGKGNLANPNKK